jgi:hypothetical protein
MEILFHNAILEEINSGCEGHEIVLSCGAKYMNVFTKP